MIADCGFGIAEEASSPPSAIRNPQFLNDEPQFSRPHEVRYNGALEGVSEKGEVDDEIEQYSDDKKSPDYNHSG